MASATQIMGLLAGVAGGFVVGLFGFRATQSAPPPSTKAIVSKEVKYSVRTEPFGATISVDNQVVGTAPMILTFSTTKEKPSYSLSFSHPGYSSKQLELRPEKDEEATITLSSQ